MAEKSSDRGEIARLRAGLQCAGELCDETDQSAFVRIREAGTAMLRKPAGQVSEIAAVARQRGFCEPVLEPERVAEIVDFGEIARVYVSQAGLRGVNGLHGSAASA